MWLMVIPGIVSLVCGVMFFCAPKRLVLTKSAAPRSWIETDPFFMKHRISAGICLIAVGLFDLSSAYYVWLRLHS